MNYIAIIGKISSLNRDANDTSVQREINTVFHRINRQYSDELASPFALTKEDEFQAFCKPSPHLFLMIDQIQVAFNKTYTLNWGLGLGGILTAINSSQDREADGPAYWEAHKALNLLQNQDDYGRSHLAFSSEYPQINRVIYPLLTSSEFIRTGWNSSQLALFKTLLDNRI